MIAPPHSVHRCRRGPARLGRVLRDVAVAEGAGGASIDYNTKVKKPKQFFFSLTRDEYISVQNEFGNRFEGGGGWPSLPPTLLAFSTGLAFTPPQQKQERRTERLRGLRGTRGHERARRAWGRPAGFTPGVFIPGAGMRGSILME